MNSSGVMLQAQQYAAAEGDIVRYTAYNDLAAQNKTKITDTNFFKEISIGTESDYTDTIKQKIVTVKIYKGSDVLPCYRLEVPRLSANTSDAKGVPVGTVITWASNNPPTENGTWLECNGQSCAAYPVLVAVLGKNTVPDMRNVVIPTSKSTDININNAKIVGVASKIGCGPYDDPEGSPNPEKFYGGYSLVLGKTIYWNAQTYSTSSAIKGLEIGTASFPISDLTGVSANLISSLSLKFYIKAV